MKEKQIFWINDRVTHMCQGNWTRPITDPSFFVESKMDWMERNNIDTSVVLTLSQLYCNGYERNIAKDVIQFQNDFNASLQKEYGDKFIAGFVVQPLYVEDALKEIDRCYSMGLNVMCLPTHYLDKNTKWQSISNIDTIPIFELADDYGLAIEIHPYQAEDIISLEDKYWRFHLIWMCAQTADAYHMFTMMDFDNRFTRIRTCFAHGNQFGHMNLGRRVQGYKGRPDLFEGAKDPRNHEKQENIFFDSLVHDTLSFELMVKRCGVQQIVCGIDDPYPLGEMDSVPDCYPGKLIDDAVSEKIINSEEAALIWHDNALKWIYG
jgi:aminocarboxymuconate-semialdehyde decarboxylase